MTHSSGVESSGWYDGGYDGGTTGGRRGVQLGSTVLIDCQSLTFESGLRDAIREAPIVCRRDFSGEASETQRLRR